MDKVVQEFHLEDVPQFLDVEEMLETVRPEVFVFVTYPDMRLNMIELGIKYGVKAVSLEKPMAESLQEAKKMVDLCREHRIKAVVCHQQKYLSQFQRMKEEHFYPWLRTLVDVCRQESGKGVSGMQLCWDLEQYAPEDIPDTVVTPMGRFRLGELARMVEQGGMEALAGRFFLWNGRTRDARFYRNRAINALWEDCCFAPSARSGEDAAGNAAILDDLERAAQMDPSLPLPRSAYEEVCALAGRAPVLPDGPALTEEFSPGYRRDLVTYGVGALRLTLPGGCLQGWEPWQNGGGAHLWTDGKGPVWRVSAYRMREGTAQFTENLDALHGVEGRTLKGGALRWGWKEVFEDGERLYQAECEVIAGPDLYFITVTCAGPGELGPVAELIGKVSVVSSAAREETVRAQ